MLFGDQQRQFMIWLSQFQVHWLDPLYYLDTTYSSMAVIAFVWVGFSYRWGIRLAYLGYFSYLSNGLVKQFFDWPRPSTDMPELSAFHPASGGFPSGGAQTAILIGLILWYYFKRPWLGLVIALFLSFIRIYLGVHYPLDIVGGWIVGGLLFYLFVKLDQPLEKWFREKGLIYAFLVSIAIPLLMDEKPAKMVLLGAGICLSLKYKLYLPPPKTIFAGIARGVTGVVGALIFSSIWVSLLASPFIKAVDSLFLSVRKAWMRRGR